eukprot:maker-scaffold_2-snap-gene-6.47-mRNA-1 protein AED:0.02 eAED:0.02 QI:46/1/1/1/0.75/0.6/5/155/545
MTDKTKRKKSRSKSRKSKNRTPTSEENEVSRREYHKQKKLKESGKLRNVDERQKPKKHKTAGKHEKRRKDKDRDKKKKKKERRERKKVKARGLAVPQKDTRWHRFQSYLPPNGADRGVPGLFSNFNAYKDKLLGLTKAKIVTPEKAQVVDQDTGFAAVSPSGRNRCLLIGINYPGSDAELSGCINDVFMIKNFLLKEGFVETEHSMQILIDIPRPGTQYPTKNNILKGMQWLVHNVEPGDTLFLGYMGHGAQVTDESGHEKDGMNEVLLPSDYMSQGLISDDEIWEILVRDLPSGVKLIALMDCCHSGTGMDLSFNWLRGKGTWEEEPNPSFSEGDVILFSGCDDHQESADAYNKVARAPGGAMTTAFCEAYAYLTMKNKGEKPTFDDFMTAVHSSIKKRGFDQTPQLSSSQQWDPTARRFDLKGLNYENANPEKGKLVLERFEPQTPKYGNSPVGKMLLAAGFAVIVGNVVGDAIDDAIDNSGDIGGAVTDQFQEVGGGFEEFGNTIGEGTTGFVDGFAEVGEAGFGGLGAVLEGIGGLLGAFL